MYIILADLSPFIKELFVSEHVAFCDGYKFDHLKRCDARSYIIDRYLKLDLSNETNDEGQRSSSQDGLHYQKRQSIICI